MNDQVNVTLYSHNLNECFRAFDTNLTVKDFNKNLLWVITRAKKVTYVNPKGESTVIKEVVARRGKYDVD